MRPIDADALYAVLDNIADHWFEEKSEPQNSMAQTVQYVMGIVMDQPNIIQPPNDPLTLEELREMDGEPVWVVGVSSINHFKGQWDICEWENGEVVNLPHCMESPDIMLLGKTWLAYRRKPE